MSEALALAGHGGRRSRRASSSAACGGRFARASQPTSLRCGSSPAGCCGRALPSPDSTSSGAGHLEPAARLSRWIRPVTTGRDVADAAIGRHRPPTGAGGWPCTLAPIR